MSQSSPGSSKLVSGEESFFLFFFSSGDNGPDHCLRASEYWIYMHYLGCQRGISSAMLMSLCVRQVSFIYISHYHYSQFHNQGGLHSVQHTIPSVPRPSVRMRKTPPKSPFNRKGIEETSGKAAAGDRNAIVCSQQKITVYSIMMTKCRL